MKKILWFIILLLSIYLLNSCKTIEEELNEKFVVKEKNGFIIASDENTNDYVTYTLLGLGDLLKNKEDIVFPQRIDNINSSIIGYFSSLFGFNSKIYPFILPFQKKVYLNGLNRINSYLDFKMENNLKLFIPQDAFFGNEESLKKFKKNFKTNFIYYNYNYYKKIYKNNIDYNIQPANLSYYIDDDYIYFIDDVDGTTPNVIPPIPYNDGYIFEGWFLDKNYTQKLDFKNYLFPKKNYLNGEYNYEENKVYAKWKKISNGDK